MTRKDVHCILLNEKGQVIKQNQEWCLYEFSRAALKKCHKLCDYKQEKSILSQFWRAEVQNQGVGRAVHPLKSLTRCGGSLPHLLQLLMAAGPRCSFVPPASFMWYSPCGSAFTWPSSDKHKGRTGLGTHSTPDFPGGSDSKVSACNEGDPGLIPGLARYPGEGNGTPLQYSCLENPMDGGA